MKKSLAIIPNFQFAENAVENVSRTSNWLISWIITLQYDTTVDQLKTVRNEIESYIKRSEDFNTDIGIAVRIDKFSDSSIDMYVRCFTKTNSWNEMLSVKERLAIEIKQIVENNKASQVLRQYRDGRSEMDKLRVHKFTTIRSSKNSISNVNGNLLRLAA